jgi:two-component system response regulator DegU
MARINICLVDDHQIFRKAMMRLVKTFNRIGDVTEAGNGNECLELLKQNLPDVVLLDLEMPGMNGLECAEHLLQKYPDLKIIILTMHDSERYMAYMLELGVHSFLLKNTAPEELEKAISSVVDLDFYHNDVLSSVIRRSLKEKLKKERPNFGAKAELTDREREVLRLICEELTFKEISDRLSVNEKTIYTHKSNIQDKLGVKGTVGLVKAAYEMGILHEKG